jgi:hypothetical protein
MKLFKAENLRLVTENTIVIDATFISDDISDDISKDDEKSKQKVIRKDYVVNAHDANMKDIFKQMKDGKWGEIRKSPIPMKNRPVKITGRDLAPMRTRIRSEILSMTDFTQLDDYSDEINDTERQNIKKFRKEIRHLNENPGNIPIVPEFLPEGIKKQIMATLGHYEKQYLQMLGNK